MGKLDLVIDELLTKSLQNLHGSWCSREDLQRTAASATLSILYNYPTRESEDDKTVNLKDICAFIDRMSVAAAPGGYLVELMPWMLHIPETATPIKTPDRNQLSNQNDMAWLAGSLYAAGAKTTSNTMSWWTLAMIAYREVRRRAQAELDTVAIVKGVPALPLGLPPQQNLKTTGTTGCSSRNINPYESLALLPRIDVLCDDAKNFGPEWYFDANGEAILGPAGIHEDGHGTFGFGRRARMGKYLANDSLFIFTATALCAAIFERVDGQEAPINTETHVDTGMKASPVRV
ncbi:hypothetical protein EDB89DRAFT_2078398 [Lactarius sanguifluus]|nr:hypothetical protein EDB89DRAFT_2078398 [Lactarius sanguifluus]